MNYYTATVRFNRVGSKPDVQRFPTHEQAASYASYAERHGLRVKVAGPWRCVNRSVARGA